MVQGLSFIEEVVASEIYLIELTDHPFKRPSVSFLSVSCILYGRKPLSTSFVVVESEYTWRGAFSIGTVVTVVSSRSRLSLKEARIFSDTKKIF